VTPDGRPLALESSRSASGSTRREWKARGLTYGPLAIAVALIAQRAIATVMAKVGHAGAALDDAYIHFQYARAIAEGHPFRFQSGEPVTSGATSLLWPVMLAPFWAVGARDDAILWPAWGLSFVALGALAWEASRLTEPLAGRTAATGAAAMTIAFGGFVWCAASGMEVVPFAWAIARATRRSSDWAEARFEARTRRDAAELVALAWMAALFRPEGAVTAGLVAATLACFPRAGPWRSRAASLAALVAVAAGPLLLWMLTGSPRSSTAIVKLLPGNPYYAGPDLAAAVTKNAKMLVDTILDGEIWSAEFIPHHGAPFALAGLAAVAVLGLRMRRRWRASGVILLALTIFAPCFYLTFLWNRLRYLWPFATGWMIGLACLARIAGDVAGLFRPRWRVTTGIACGVFVGLFGSKLEWSIEDVGQSASGIARQQVALGRWARDNLPAEARIGVNDTGAIAYFSDRRTFDIVGLTTRDEARYWVAGAGSRLEHYERLADKAASTLPTHFIVYPEWMAMNMCLGAPLTEATVTDSTILGGQTMRAYLADWSKLGSGERPWTPTGDVIDALDVADLESEAEHEYELLRAHDGEQIARQGLTPDGAIVVDGGRTGRTLERFIAHLPVGIDAHGIARFEGRTGTTVRVVANGEPLALLRVDADDSDWIERAFDVPARTTGPRTHIELQVMGGPITTFHYWFVRRQ
jgi:hypothetical protein